MQHTEHRIYLLKQYLNGSIHPDNHLELKSLFEQYPGLFEIVTNLENPDNLQQALHEYKYFHSTVSAESKDRVLDNILQKIQTDSKPKRKILAYRPLLRYVAAACVLTILSVSIWKISKKSSSTDLHALQQAEKLHPGSNRATLLSADGSIIELNQEHNGIIMGDHITYNDGSVLLNDIDDEGKLLTLSTPKGGQYQVILPDGSKVWLNAASKLRYPKKFLTSQRNVELDGEAYFEVARNEKQPFIVKTPNEQVEVLGTHFNINSYSEDKVSKVALVEGKVKVATHSQSKILQPGQQSRLKNQQMDVQEVNTEEIIAWKNGEFAFNNESLGTSMRQLARWYDIDIQVDPSLEQLALWGSVSRLDNFDKVLKIIKMTDDNIKINIEGRRVKIMK